MTEVKKPKAEKLTQAQKRDVRLAATMRENLKKRKAAARKAAQKEAE